jgi:hypothetical protein
MVFIEWTLFDRAGSTARRRVFLLNETKRFLPTSRVNRRNLRSGLVGDERFDFSN